MTPWIWIALGALLAGSPAAAERVTCPDGARWAGNDLRQCPCCTRCADGTWVKGRGPCAGVRGKARADGCARFAQLVPLLGVENPLAESAHAIRPRNRIALRERPAAAGGGRVVGELATGSSAEILEERAEELRVRSPRDATVGWIGRKLVDRVVLQHPKSGELCSAQ